MSELREVARSLFEKRVHLFFRHRAHFLDPLVPSEWEALREDPEIRDPAVLRVVEEVLPGRLPDLARGIYFPVPIARSLADGEETETVLARFHYELVHVDDDQVWRWKGRPLAPKVQRFFLEHLSWHSALDVYFFEYRVHEEWWDKSYLEVNVTPMVVRQIAAAEAGRLEVSLNNSRQDRLDLQTLRLDERERLFCRSLGHGEVMMSDAVRFELLKDVDEDLTTLYIGGARYPLRWP